jgi:hypothetical protein
MKKLGIAAIVLLVLCIVPTALVSRWMVVTPDVVLRRASIGSVVSTRMQRNWTPVDDLTYVTTTTGLFAVEGLVSTPHGEPLQVQDSVQLGIRVCPVGSSAGCTRLAGPYAGALLPVPHVPTAMDHARWELLANAVFVWALAFGLASVLAGMFWVVLRMHDDDDDVACKDE